MLFKKYIKTLKHDNITRGYSKIQDIRKDLGKVIYDAAKREYYRQGVTFLQESYLKLVYPHVSESL